MKINETGAVLSDQDWIDLANALKSTRYSTSADKLKESRNGPRPAREVLDAHDINQGEEGVNQVLKRHGLPFRLKRIGAWWKGQDRKDRPLAFVRIALPPDRLL